MEHEPYEDEEARAAAEEARRIGGVAGDEDIDPAQRPLVEAGEGEAEGFELAEDDLIEHASHGDEHSARVPYYDAEDVSEDDRVGAEYGEADEEETSEDEP
jgi:hypothetical protein